MSRTRSSVPSARQIEILKYLRTYIRRRRFAPSVREIQKAQNISSTSIVSYHLRSLQSKRLIHRVPHTARTIKLTRLGIEFVKANTSPLSGD
jgi:repressor LexA